MVSPTFSVVIATFGRGALIDATLESVARQTVDDIEVLVASDGPAATGLAETVERFGDRFRVLETAARCGSQFGPNNLGWSAAAGEHVAYLGHDDVWLPGHLAALRRAFEREPRAEFAASGCVFFGPPGAGDGHTWVTGMFDPTDRWMALTHFFPPSSVAHRRNLPEELRWPDAAVVRRPVDSQFMFSAAQRGCIFTSTGTITVLKFNSALRYLSYLSPDDDEQRAALALIDDPTQLHATIDAAVTEVATSGNYMSTLHPAERDRQPGEALRINARIRGIDTPPLVALDGPTWMPVDDGPRAFDWHGLERDGDRTWRWSGPNPRPRLLIPFVHEGPVRLTLHLAAVANVDVLDSLAVLVNGTSLPTAVRRASDGSILVELEASLHADRASVVELRMIRTVPVVELAPGSADSRRVGVSLAGVQLEPLG